MSEKREGQQLKILKLLHQRGAQGVTNIELNNLCLRYGARLFDLRKHWDIVTKQESEGVFRFTLKGKKQAEQLRLIA